MKFFLKTGDMSQILSEILLIELVKYILLVAGKIDFIDTISTDFTESVTGFSLINQQNSTDSI